MRAIFLIPAIGLLAACETVTPVTGVGFNTPEYQAQREAALSGQGAVGTPLTSPSVISSEELAAAGIPVAGQYPAPANGGGTTGVADQTAAALAGTTPQVTSAPLETVASTSSAGISDEQDFEAVANRQTIESDAARIEQNRASYEVVAPTAVPQRSGDAAPNIVQYALNTSNPVGVQVYSRAGFNLQAKAQRNCAKYPSPDQAQLEFLSNGGPQRDRKGLDPDGDGYACGWDPGPFRRAVSN